MAAPNYVSITGSGSRLQGQVRQYLDALRQAKELGNDVKNTLNQAAGDPNFSFAVDLGFSNDQAGQDIANAINNSVATSVSDLNASAAITDALNRFL